jgi:YL1 nuclear protein C-terminal domain
MGGPQDAQRKAWNEAMRSAAGASALPPSLLQNTTTRRSDRRKKQARREKARKAIHLGDASSQLYRAAVWMDALEEVDPSGNMVEDDEEYDELDEIDAKRKRRKSSAAKKVGILPKRFKPRSLASILVEEASREDGVSRAFLDAEATLAPSQRLPPRKFCPVTGLFGIYTDPKSGIPYANLKALEQIQERAPPWMTLGGTAAYFEAATSLRNEE